MEHALKGRQYLCCPLGCVSAWLRVSLGEGLEEVDLVNSFHEEGLGFRA